MGFAIRTLLTHGLVCATLIVAGCAPAPPVEPATPAIPSQTLIAPTDLRADLGHLTATLRWTTNQPENRVISGYHIYLAEEGQAPVRVSDLPYPGDTNPDHAVETYLLENLAAGREYRAHVTVVYPGDLESAPTNTVVFIARPQGRFQLRESFSGPEGGFSFDQRSAVPTDDLSNDIYLAVIRGALHLASPRRIDTILRSSELYRLRTKQPISKLTVIEKPEVAESTCPVTEDEVILLRDASGCFALLRIEAVDRVDRIVTIDYIYQTRPGVLRFH